MVSGLHSGESEYNTCQVVVVLKEAFKMYFLIFSEYSIIIMVHLFSTRK